MKPSSKLTTPKTETKLNFRKNPATHAYLIEKKKKNQDNFVKGT